MMGERDADFTEPRRSAAFMPFFHSSLSLNLVQLAPPLIHTSSSPFSPSLPSPKIIPLSGCVCRCQGSGSLGVDTILLISAKTGRCSAVFRLKPRSGFKVETPETRGRGGICEGGR